MEWGRYHRSLVKAALPMQFKREDTRLRQLIIVERRKELALKLRSQNPRRLVADVGGVLDLLQKADRENRLLPLKKGNM
ncbi:MAG TPA: hypothetical protein VEF35_01510 [Candidatus Bathyarchaeia archaeon]|nr:hypothetical protein [Candidatus Bathyarchaeia archaeon]